MTGAVGATDTSVGIGYAAPSGSTANGNSGNPHGGYGSAPAVRITIENLAVTSTMQVPPGGPIEVDLIAGGTSTSLSRIVPDGRHDMHVHPAGDTLPGELYQFYFPTFGNGTAFSSDVAFGYQIVS